MTESQVGQTMKQMETILFKRLDPRAIPPRRAHDGDAGWEQGMERYARAAGTYDCPAWRFAMATCDRRAGEIRLEEWGGAKE